VPIVFGMNHLTQTILDGARNLWDSFAVRTLAILCAVAIVPCAFLLHVSETLAR